MTDRLKMKHPPPPGGQGVLNKLAERFRTAPRARGARGRVHSRGKSAARARRARRARAARAHVEKRAARAAVYIISGLTFFLKRNFLKLERCVSKRTFLKFF